MLNNQSEKLDSLQADVKEIKNLLTSVQADQVKCNSRWDMLNKVFSFLIGGLGLSGVISVINSWWGHK